MTFDDDFIRILTASGRKDVTCKNAGVEWPPPERMIVNGMHVRRIRMSQLTDEDRAEMTHVCRGAEYEIALIN